MIALRFAGGPRNAASSLALPQQGPVLPGRAAALRSRLFHAYQPAGLSARSPSPRGKAGRQGPEVRRQSNPSRCAARRQGRSPDQQGGEGFAGRADPSAAGPVCEPKWTDAGPLHRPRQGASRSPAARKWDHGRGLPDLRPPRSACPTLPGHRRHRPGFGHTERPRHRVWTARRRRTSCIACWSGSTSNDPSSSAIPGARSSRSPLQPAAGARSEAWSCCPATTTQADAPTSPYRRRWRSRVLETRLAP